MQRRTASPGFRIAVALVIALETCSMFVSSAAQAANFTTAYMRMDRMKINSVTGGLVCARVVSTTPTEAKLKVTFPSTYTLSTTAANWGVSTAANLIPAGATAWPGITAPGGGDIDNTLKTVVFASSDLTSAATTYCFVYGTGATKPVTLPGTTANSQQAAIETQTAASAPIDATPIALATIADDQILVTAVVPPIFQFTITPDNTEPFSANLDPSTVISTAGTVVTVNTNAKGGWIAWAKDSEQGLHSTTASYTIPTTGTVNGAPSQLTNGVAGYVMDVDATDTGTSACTATADPEYAATQPTTHGGTLSADFQPIGVCSGGTSDGDQLTLVERAAIGVTTPAATDYSDIITVVGAGNF